MTMAGFAASTIAIAVAECSALLVGLVVYRHTGLRGLMWYGVVGLVGLGVGPLQTVLMSRVGSGLMALHASGEPLPFHGATLGEVMASMSYGVHVLGGLSRPIVVMVVLADWVEVLARLGAPCEGRPLRVLRLLSGRATAWGMAAVCLSVLQPCLTYALGEYVLGLPLGYR